MCRTRLRSPGKAQPAFLPTVHPLFLALDLAQDRARGREILAQWTPDHPRSTVSGDPPLIALPESTRPLLEAARAVLATPGLPPVVLIGGLAVTMRVSAAGAAHRATVDIDLVTLDAEPEAVQVLSDAHATPKQSLTIGEVKVDVIATSPVTDLDLEGLDDQNRLFVAAHRWAFESGHPARMTTSGTQPLDALVGATKQMSGAAREELDVDEVRVVLGDLVDELRG